MQRAPCKHKWERTLNDTDKTKQLVCRKCMTVKTVGRTEHY